MWTSSDLSLKEVLLLCVVHLLLSYKTHALRCWGCDSESSADSPSCQRDHPGQPPSDMMGKPWADQGVCPSDHVCVSLYKNKDDQIPFRRACARAKPALKAGCEEDPYVGGATFKGYGCFCNEEDLCNYRKGDQLPKQTGSPPWLFPDDEVNGGSKPTSTATPWFRSKPQRNNASKAPGNSPAGLEIDDASALPLETTTNSEASSREDYGETRSNSRNSTAGQDPDDGAAASDENTAEIENRIFFGSLSPAVHSASDGMFNAQRTCQLCFLLFSVTLVLSRKYFLTSC